MFVFVSVLTPDCVVACVLGAVFPLVREERRGSAVTENVSQWCKQGGDTFTVHLQRVEF